MAGEPTRAELAERPLPAAEGEALAPHRDARHVTPASADPPSASGRTARGSASEVGAAADSIPAHTDWLYHHLTVSGPAALLSVFRAAAAGAGVIPWRLDLDRMEADFFLRLVAPATPQQRRLSLEGARLLASELRGAVARRHARATARVGRSHACGFDLHALVPVPGEVLRLGPDHPDALRWLWSQWGTTQALRHVAPVATPKTATAPEVTEFRVSFWAADWTPWQALERIRAAWPGLRFDVRPVYELT